MERVTVKQLLKCDLKGKIVCFPTDTVYGVGAMIDDSKAIDKIYQMKNRDYSKPLAILTSTSNIDYYVKNVSEKAKELMKLYWPGALTLIFEKNNNLRGICDNYNTIGFRMPDSKISIDILNHFGLMATTSVNISGTKELNNIDDIEKMFSKYIDYLVIDNAILSKTSSTVVDVTNEEIKILRQGNICIK